MLFRDFGENSKVNSVIFVKFKERLTQSEIPLQLAENFSTPLYADE